MVAGRVEGFGASELLMPMPSCLADTFQFVFRINETLLPIEK